MAQFALPLFLPLVCVFFTPCGADKCIRPYKPLAQSTSRSGTPYMDLQERALVIFANVTFVSAVNRQLRIHLRNANSDEATDQYEIWMNKDHLAHGVTADSDDADYVEDTPWLHDSMSFSPTNDGDNERDGVPMLTQMSVLPTVRGVGNRVNIEVKWLKSPQWKDLFVSQSMRSSNAYDFPKWSTVDIHVRSVEGKKAEFSVPLIASFDYNVEEDKFMEIMTAPGGESCYEMARLSSTITNLFDKTQEGVKYKELDMCRLMSLCNTNYAKLTATQREVIITECCAEEMKSGETILNMNEFMGRFESTYVEKMELWRTTTEAPITEKVTAEKTTTEKATIVEATTEKATIVEVTTARATKPEATAPTTTNEAGTTGTADVVAETTKHETDTTDAPSANETTTNGGRNANETRPLSDNTTARATPDKPEQKPDVTIAPTDVNPVVGITSPVSTTKNGTTSTAADDDEEEDSNILLIVIIVIVLLLLLLCCCICLCCFMRRRKAGAAEEKKDEEKPKEVPQAVLPVTQAAAMAVVQPISQKPPTLVATAVHTDPKLNDEDTQPGTVSDVKLVSEQTQATHSEEEDGALLRALPVDPSDAAENEEEPLTVMGEVEGTAKAPSNVHWQRQ